MKTKLFLIAIFLLYGLTAFSQEKPDFPVQEIDNQGKIAKKVIPDTYLIFFNEEDFQPFVNKNPAKESDNRESRGNAAKNHEQQMIVQLRKIAQEKLGIPPSMILEYYTVATTGIKVQVKNANAKGLLEKLKAVKEVAAMLPDFEINAMFDNVSPLPLPAQTVCWGVSLVGSGNYTGNKWAWVLDTGIDLTHPDLNVAGAPYAASFIPTQSYADGNGHGTHVAGIIAARNNSIGTLGVAAGARVVPVKVLDNSGMGTLSSICLGLDHVGKYCIPGDVVNLSLGGPAPDWIVDNFAPWDPRKIAENSIINLGKAGVYCVIAAGNENSHANNHTPARVNGTRIYTISAMDRNRNIASFSNYGNAPVDYAAPGVSILSTYMNGGYATMSGTSMATPLVSGILLINNGLIRTNGFLNTDKDGSKDPIAIK